MRDDEQSRAALFFATPVSKIGVIRRDEQKLEAAKNKLNGDDLVVFVLDAANKERLSHAFCRICAFDHLVLALGSGKEAVAFASVSPIDVRQAFEEKVLPHLATAQKVRPM